MICPQRGVLLRNNNYQSTRVFAPAQEQIRHDISEFGTCASLPFVAFFGLAAGWCCHLVSCGVAFRVAFIDFVCRLHRPLVCGSLRFGPRIDSCRRRLRVRSIQSLAWLLEAGLWPGPPIRWFFSSSSEWLSSPAFLCRLEFVTLWFRWRSLPFALRSVWIYRGPLSSVARSLVAMFVFVVACCFAL